MEEGVWDKCFNFCFLLHSQGVKAWQGCGGRGGTPCCQTASESGDGRQSFDDVLETSVWGSVFLEKLGYF